MKTIAEIEEMTPSDFVAYCLWQGLVWGFMGLTVPFRLVVGTL